VKKILCGRFPHTLTVFRDIRGANMPFPKFECFDFLSSFNAFLGAKSSIQEKCILMSYLLVGKKGILRDTHSEILHTMYMYLKDLQIVYICYFASNFDEFFL
jgi:hypothetical protein